MNLYRSFLAFLLRIEYAGHRVDEYLYSLQGRSEEAADSFCRAKEIERRLCWMAIQ